jgi:hypothetical protein
MTSATALSVRCLGCGSVYLKPLGGGTASDNPGCPRCDYVGWVPIEQSFSPASEQHRSGEDPPPDPPWQRG